MLRLFHTASRVAVPVAVAIRGMPTDSSCVRRGVVMAGLARRFSTTLVLQRTAAAGGVGDLSVRDAPPAEDDGTRLPSPEVHDEPNADEAFDELEAASQEIHDLCFGMMAFLRRADPDVTKDLFERRVKKRLREPVPEPRRRLLHGHGDRGAMRLNTFRSEKDLQEATQLYFQLGEKLMLLLHKPVMDRLLKSAGKGHRDLRSDGVHKLRRPMERASWRTFPYRWFKHSPFEVQQLRADIPQSAVDNTRFYRDHATLRYLFTLMEPQHPYRAPLEKRMFEITQRYDPVEVANQKAPRQ